jgi:hypothetical protein
MNKYMGFYELKAINLPTVKWRLFTKDTSLDATLLWTVRVAVERSDDLNLPRIVGATSEEALIKGRELLREYEGKGIVIYYPYFIAQKSGVLDINRDRTVVEAVDRDLWNLVTYGRKNVTAVFPARFTFDQGILCSESGMETAVNETGSAPSPENVQYFGDKHFLDRGELEEIFNCTAVIRGRFREELYEGKSILAEWSFAYDTDTRHEPKGGRYLVFYELRGL